jgi:hypothetical protein
MLELQAHLHENLPQELFLEMKRIIQKCRSMPEVYLFSACRKHAADAQEEFNRNPHFNLKAADQLATAFSDVQLAFPKLPEPAQVGLKAAMYYFALDDDGQPDFATFDGLDDDILVANCCFEFAQRSDLIIHL